jgi:hypothetical protein
MPERAIRSEGAGEREVSRGRISPGEFGVKDRTEERANRAWVSQAKGLRCPGNWSCRLRAGVKPRG